MKDIFIGAAYYPEMWDEAEVNKDIARCNVRVQKGNYEKIIASKQLFSMR